MVVSGTNGAAGVNTATIYLYRRLAATPAIPSATITYTFATGAVTGITNSWTTTVPANDGN
jgi:hypothetical protein